MAGGQSVIQRRGRVRQAFSDGQTGRFSACPAQPRIYTPPGATGKEIRAFSARRNCLRRVDYGRLTHPAGTPRVLKLPRRRQTTMMRGEVGSLFGADL